MKGELGDLGIPTLDLSMQARRQDMPERWHKWGREPRGSRGLEAWHFYCEDYKFNGLWRSLNDPRAPRSPVVESGARVAVECNFSTGPRVARAQALHDVFRKRTLACHWQRGGIRVVVDLCVAEGFRDLMLLGVPPGWGAYATRKAHSDRGADLDRDYEAACEHYRMGLGSEVMWASPLFIVFGGGKMIRKYCQERSWLWVPEASTLARGRDV